MYRVVTADRLYPDSFTVRLNLILVYLPQYFINILVHPLDQQQMYAEMPYLNTKKAPSDNEGKYTYNSPNSPSPMLRSYIIGVYLRNNGIHK